MDDNLCRDLALVYAACKLLREPLDDKVPGVLEEAVKDAILNRKEPWQVELSYMVDDYEMFYNYLKERYSSH